MKWSKPIGLLLAAILCMVHSMPTETTTRSTSTIRSTTKKPIHRLESNNTSLDMIFDIRTPPKVKQQVQNKMKLKHEIENSHAGIAIPIDEDTLEIEETTKKLNFYKIERPTTNSGLSTWILLSGQDSSTTRSPSTYKPIIKPTPEQKPQQNVTMMANNKPVRIVKPIFKQRTTTTTAPKSTTITTTTQASITTTKPITKLTKVKASVLNNSVHKKDTTDTTTTTKKYATTTGTTTTEKPVSSTHLTVKKTITAANATLPVSDSSTLPLESKNTDVDLPETDIKKKKSTNKKNKNKTRRRKPGKETNSTSISKPTKGSLDNPISTQLYNYLAREIMPTVGVGLVGLMVTAGLASYFLYPFGAARRNDNIDRKDKEGSYYYNNEYSGGMPEEEAIGKVIAGMPGNSLFENSYKTPTSRKAYVNTKYRLTDRRAPVQQVPQIQPNNYGGMTHGIVEDVPLTSLKEEDDIVYDTQSYQSSNYEPVSYSNDAFSPMIDQKFVVGSIPKDMVTEVTPAAVPEHGPRTLNFGVNYAQEPVFVVGSRPQEIITNIKEDALPAHKPRSLNVRRKRETIPNDMDNEIFPSLDTSEVTTSNDLDETTSKDVTAFISSSTKQPELATVSMETTTDLPQKVNSFIDLMRELIHLKARIGLQMMQNVTRSISTYISRVQTRLDEHYRNNKQK